MKRPLLLIPLLALAAVPCLAQDPATNAPMAEAAQTNAVPLRWGVVPFPDGFALFDRFVELVHAPPRYDLAGIGFGWYDKARDAYGAQLDILLASAENVRGVQFGLFGANAKTATGVTAGLCTVSGRTDGLSVSLILGLSEQHRGIQLSGVFSGADEIGCQFGEDADADAIEAETPLSWGVNAALWKVRARRFWGVEVGGAAAGGNLIDGLVVGSLTGVRRMRGLQAGGVNSSFQVRGAEIGLVNVATDLDGLQCGIWNEADTLHGLQIGVYNRARNGAGVQIGFVNGFGPPGDALWLPLVNARF